MEVHGESRHIVVLRRGQFCESLFRVASLRFEEGFLNRMASRWKLTLMA